MLFKFFKVLLFVYPLLIYSQGKLVLDGVIINDYDEPIPYAAVGIVAKNIGVATTDEGQFHLVLTSNERNDILEVSSIGYETFKISVQDFINRDKQTIILKENVTQLDDVELLAPKEYVSAALKNLKNTTVSKPHQLSILYRRASVEDYVSRFFVEQYMHVVDRGPSGHISRLAVREMRKSADYRYVKIKQKIHAVNYMDQVNPLKNGVYTNGYNWKKIGDSNYDGEDLVILEGTRKKGYGFLRLYVGIDTYAVYKIETNILDATYIYKKNKEGKLYLSYHNREWKNKNAKVPPHLHSAYNLQGKKVPKSIPVSYRHEVYVMDLKTNKKEFDLSGPDGEGMDMSEIQRPYNANFWKTISLPPPTAFYKKIKEELESNFNVPLEVQFQHSN